jgi:hypothetical protein
MKYRSSLGFFVVIAVLVVVGGAGVWTQWLRTMSLRTELETARAEADQLERLRMENARLRRQQIPPAQLEALRADHAALPQLRAQVEALSKPTAP